jgi:hypothetical protein
VNMKKKYAGSLTRYLLSFLTKYDEKKFYNMLFLMLDPIPKGLLDSFVFLLVMNKVWPSLKNTKKSLCS